MKRLKALFIISLAFVALMVVGIGGFSAGNAPSGGCGQSCGSSCGAPAAQTNAAPELNLTAMQTQKIADIEKDRDTKLEGLHARLKAKNDQVAKLIADPKASRESIKKAVYEMSNAHADIQLTNIFAQREKDKVLTPAQRAIAAKATGCSCGCGSK